MWFLPAPWKAASSSAITSWWTAWHSRTGSFGGSILPYRDVQRGDIVAFLYPEAIRQTYVKRVIGLPGDRIHPGTDR